MNVQSSDDAEAMANSQSNNRPETNSVTRAHDLFQSPLDWDAIRGDATELELEVGSGKGLFLQAAARAQPETRFIGIELSAKFANRAASRLAKSAPDNTLMLRGDAQVFLEQIVPDQAVNRVHVYFPDPWWRNKHKKRRVLNDQALADIVRILRPRGEFHFWTDVLDYYELICGQVMDHTDLTGPEYVPERGSQHDMDFTTHFERRARLNSQPVYRAIFRKPK